MSAIHLIGLAMDHKTTNINNQAAFDCGNHWQKFEKQRIADKVPGKISDDIIAVYHNYEGDYRKPYSYFIGCRVKEGTVVPEGMDSLIIPAAKYQKITARGAMPDCVADAWHEIWKTEKNRAYSFDYEVYGERSKNWQNAEVDIFIALQS